ncbi:MAG: hypothetical protein VB853_01670 [Pirellulales bacterium]
MESWLSIRVHLCQPVDFDQSACSAIKFGLGGVTNNTKLYFESKSDNDTLTFQPNSAMADFISVLE